MLNSKIFFSLLRLKQLLHKDVYIKGNTPYKYFIYGKEILKYVSN